jgi:hypothetical protein
MIDVNTLYRVPKDLCYKYLKQFVPKKSIKLAFYRSCLDYYITKKTIWNIVPSLSKDGVLCVEVFLNNISNVIKFCEDNNYYYDTLIFYNPKFDKGLGTNFINCGIYFVLIYKEKPHKVSGGNILYIDNHKDMYREVLTRICDTFSSPVNILLLIGDTFLPFIEDFKILCRYIIAFGNDDFFAIQARKNGMREVEVDL